MNFFLSSTFSLEENDVSVLTPCFLYCFVHGTCGLLCVSFQPPQCWRKESALFLFFIISILVVLWFYPHQFLKIVSFDIIFNDACLNNS